MDSIAQEQELSETEKRLHWQRVEREALAFCTQLSGMLRDKRKGIMSALDVSEGQLSRELSENYDNRLSLTVALYILRESQDPRLARIIFCEGAGYQLPEPQKQKFTEADWKRAYDAECRESGNAGLAIHEGAKRRLRSGK